MRKIVMILCIAVCLTYVLPMYAQGEPTDSRLWGVWQATYDDPIYDYPVYVTFTPNGAWGDTEIEGIYYGSYTADGSTLTIQANGEYAVISHWTDQFSYEVNGNKLQIFNGRYDHSEFKLVVRFTGFGFLHCPATVESNMFVGSFGHITYTDGTPSRLRSGPSLTSTVIDQLPEGAGFVVVGDPVCSDGYTWWPVNTSPYNTNTGNDNNKLVGWIAEGEDGVAFIEPIGWIDTNLLRVTIQSEEDVISAIAKETGATVYAPGMYGHIEEAGRALGSGLTGQRLANVMTAVRTSYLIVVKRDIPNFANPVEVVCTASTLADFGVIEKNIDDPVLACAFLDYKDYVSVAGPIAGSLFFLSQQLLTPSTILDPYLLNPIYDWSDSRPLIRFVCWVSQGSMCLK